jgi:hypothetical protein
MLPKARIEWPGGKAFAFTIVDDTDVSTVKNTKPIYDLLAENGLYTTKTVWPLSTQDRPFTGGDSLENPEYREWILDLQRQGFEIALHGVADGSSNRQRVIQGLDRFKEWVGHDPSIHINHVGQAEGVYWGISRLDPAVNWIYGAYRRRKKSTAYRGADENSPYFWGDVCRERIRYVRNLVFVDINTLKMDPLMPYYDPLRPFVRGWFSASYGSGVDRFCQLISEKNQDKLRQEGGACIAYTHFGSSFYPIKDEFRRLIRRLGSLPGWFVPTTTLLDYLGSVRGWHNVADHKRTLKKMQWRWLLQQIQRKTGS